MKKLLALIFTAFFCAVSNAEIIQVPSEYGDTPTGYWSNSKSTAVLILFPGGNGAFGLNEGKHAEPAWLTASLYNLGKVDIVFVDSPFALGIYGSQISARYTKEHVMRVESVIKFYRDKLRKPIFIMGHSNGTITEAEFLNRDSNNQKLVAGVIFSGSRVETSLDGPLNVPVLVLHHENDHNQSTQVEGAHRLYEAIQKINSAPTYFSLVHGGVSNSDPYNGGYHMFEGSLPEATELVQNFISGQSSQGKPK